MILIVEDEAISRRALKQLLQLSGFATTAVGSVEEAKQALGAGINPDVALVDVDLPGADGLELVRWLERGHPSVVPVLITASDDDRTLSFQAAHPAEFFRKPVDVDSLLGLLGRVPPA